MIAMFLARRLPFSHRLATIAAMALPVTVVWLWQIARGWPIIIKSVTGVGAEG